MFELLNAKKLGNKKAELAIAIDFRLTALAMLHEDRALRGWSMPEAGVELIHADLIKAAAEEPLIEGRNGQAAFHAESFGCRLLAIAKARGRA